MRSQGAHSLRRKRGIVPSLRRVARWLDVIAVLVILAAIARFVVLPRVRYDVLTVQAPPVSIATLDGGRFDLERRRGHLVFLDFWATWCPPCRDSIPLVQHFRRTHPGIDVVSVDVGEDPVLVRPFAARFKMDDVALDPDQTVSHAFAVGGFPTMIAIDGTGRVRARWYGYFADIEHQMANVVARYGSAPKTAAAAAPVVARAR